MLSITGINHFFLFAKINIFGFFIGFWRIENLQLVHPKNPIIIILIIMIIIRIKKKKKKQQLQTKKNLSSTH